MKKSSPVPDWPLQIPANGQHQRKIKSDNHNIDRGQMHQPVRNHKRQGLSHLQFLACIGEIR